MQALERVRYSRSRLAKHNAVMLTKRAFSALSSVACWSKIWTGARDYNSDERHVSRGNWRSSLRHCTDHDAEDEKWQMLPNDLKLLFFQARTRVASSRY